MFEVGDRIVHPHHGAGMVVSCQRRALLGGERDYLEIELDYHTLRILVPCESVDAVGLRHVVDECGLARIVAVLEGTPEAAAQSWPAREKHYRGKLSGGDVFERAAVVRDMALRAAECTLPATARELYERSRRILISELRCALGLSAESAGAYIDERLARDREGAA